MTSYYKQLIETVGEKAAKEHMKYIASQRKSRHEFTTDKARAAQKKAVASRKRNRKINEA